MNYLSQYSIAFSGLKEGVHLFDFSAENRFFDEFEESEIRKGNIRIQVKLEKRSTYLRLTFDLKGVVELMCDRCLENYLQSIESSFPMLVKYSETENDYGDEVIYIHPGAYQVEIGKLIYEFIVLSIPIRHIHPDDQEGKSLCNPDMLHKLDEYRAIDSPEANPIDPRWNDLKKIIDK